MGGFHKMAIFLLRSIALVKVLVFHFPKMLIKLFYLIRWVWYAVNLFENVV